MVGPLDVAVAAEVLRRVNRTRQVVSLVSQAIIRAYDEVALHAEVCRFLVTFGGYLMAWVGLAEEKVPRELRHAAHAGLEPNFLETLGITWPRDLDDRSPTSRALRDRRPSVARNIPTDPGTSGPDPKDWLHGHTATCALPMQFGGHGLGVLTIHSAEPNAFGSEEVSLLRELATDLAAGVIGLREQRVRQSLEDETRRAEARLRAIVDNSQDGIFEYSPEGLLISVNASLATRMGYAGAEEMIEAAPGLLTLNLHPDDAHHLAPLTDVPSGSVEVRWRRKDGGWTWVAIALQVVQGPDGLLRLGFVHDLTMDRAAADANARLASIVEAADESIVGIDARGIVTAWNEGATRLFGYGRDEALGRPIDALIVPPERVDEHGGVMAAITRGDRVARYETVRVGRNGIVRHTSATVSPIFAQGKAVVGASVVEHDVTETRLAAAAARTKELAEADVRRLKAIDAMRTTFLNEASHELNTPLTPLRIHVEALRDSTDLTAAQRSHVAVIERNVLRLCNLVRDMLETSRLETGRFELELHETPVDGLVSDVVHALRETAGRHRVRLLMETPSSAMATLDRSRIGQVLYNLISNAVSFTGEGGRVFVGARLQGDTVVVRVRDTGIGLSEDQIAMLFQPFSRPHEGKGSLAKGSGLGLFISKAIVEQHGGRIWAESAGPGAGSSFSFTLPLRGPTNEVVRSTIPPGRTAARMVPATPSPATGAPDATGTVRLPAPAADPISLGTAEGPGSGRTRSVPQRMPTRWRKHLVRTEERPMGNAHHKENAETDEQEQAAAAKAARRDRRDADARAREESAAERPGLQSQGAVGITDAQKRGEAAGGRPRQNEPSRFDAMPIAGHKRLKGYEDPAPPSPAAGRAPGQARDEGGKPSHVAAPAADNSSMEAQDDPRAASAAGGPEKPWADQPPKPAADKLAKPPAEEPAQPVADRIAKPSAEEPAKKDRRAGVPEDPATDAERESD